MAANRFFFNHCQRFIPWVRRSMWRHTDCLILEVWLRDVRLECILRVFFLEYVRGVLHKASIGCVHPVAVVLDYWWRDRLGRWRHSHQTLQAFAWIVKVRFDDFFLTRWCFQFSHYGCLRSWFLFFPFDDLALARDVGLPANVLVCRHLTLLKHHMKHCKVAEEQKCA